MKHWKTSMSGLVLLLLLGCATGPRQTSVLEASPNTADSGLSLEIGLEKDGLSKVRLSGASLQSSVVSGEAKREGEGWRITLTKLDWFDNWANGWTQATFLLDGIAGLRPSSSGWVLHVEKAPQLDAVESASIRYFDTYVRGDKGLTEFTHRWDRIQAVTLDISTRFPASAAARDRRALERYLFPEIYGYDSPPASDHAKVVGQGFEWNSDYTKEHFSEPLRILRDSGTMLRDYKESPGLWFLALEWRGFWEQADHPMVQETK
ncbi:MAG: hypothetical protein ACLQMF_09990 [Rectinemataceae bacterium]